MATGDMIGVKEVATHCSTYAGFSTLPTLPVQRQYTVPPALLLTASFFCFDGLLMNRDLKIYCDLSYLSKESQSQSLNVSEGQDLDGVYLRRIFQTHLMQIEASCSPYHSSVAGVLDLPLQPHRIFRMHHLRSQVCGGCPS